MWTRAGIICPCSECFCQGKRIIGGLSLVMPAYLLTCLLTCGRAWAGHQAAQVTPCALTSTVVAAFVFVKYVRKDRRPCLSRGF